MLLRITPNRGAPRCFRNFSPRAENLSRPAHFFSELNPPIAILAGGLATRLLPVTARIPKSLVPVHGRPFLEYQLEYLRGQGFDRIIVCAGHLGEQIQTHFGDQVEYSFDGAA